MQVSNVTNDDGRMMAQLINFLSKGRWDLTGADAEALVGVKRWASAVAGSMATQLAPAKATPTATSAATPAPASTDSPGFKIKAMGSLNAPLTRKRKKK